MASWKWWIHFEWNGDDRPVLKINLDETSVAVNQSGARGHIFVPCRARGLLKRTVPRATRRRNLTVIAIICNDVDMQSYLPQYIIANKATFKAKEFASLKVRSFFIWLPCLILLQAACPDYVTLVRQESAWNNDSLFATIILRLGWLVKEHRPNTRAILMFDSALLHLTGIFVFVLFHNIALYVTCLCRQGAAHM